MGKKRREDSRARKKQTEKLNYDWWQWDRCNGSRAATLKKIVQGRKDSKDLVHRPVCQLLNKYKFSINHVLSGMRTEAIPTENRDSRTTHNQSRSTTGSKSASQMLSNQSVKMSHNGRRGACPGGCPGGAYISTGSGHAPGIARGSSCGISTG